MANLKEKYGPNTGVPKNNGNSKQEPSWGDKLLGGIKDAASNIGTFSNVVATNISNAVQDKNVVASGNYKKVFDSSDDNTTPNKQMKKKHHTTASGGLSTNMQAYTPRKGTINNPR